MEIRPLSESLHRLAEDEINENPALVASNIQVLKEWWSKQPYLRKIKPVDQWLLAILRGCKHNLEKSQKKLENFYKLHKNAPDFYTDRDPINPRIQEIGQLGVFLPLRKSINEDSPRICIVRVGGIGSRYSLAEAMKVSFMMAEILLLEDDNFTVAGEDIIADMKDVGFNILRQWTPALARRMFMCSEGALAIRIKRLHIINAPRSLKTAVAIFKMFAKEKLRNRIYVYNQNYEEMYDTIPRSILPKEYGGNDGSIEELADHWRTKLISYRNWFLEYEKLHEVKPS